jgi:hypothetical protein
MKISITSIILLLCLISISGYSQEKYGNTFNIGLGVGGYAGYYKYSGKSLPIIHFDYEFDVAKNFTLAPFISVSSFSNSYYWGNNNTPHRFYNYRQVVIPIGAKGTYYFDDLLNAGSEWDFYAAGSLGLALIKSRWDDGYGGDRNVFNSGNSLFLNLHIGVEYHLNDRLGVFLDLSSGVSTIGLAIHGR